MKRIVLLDILSFFFFVSLSIAGSNFLKFDLPNHISVELPKNWEIRSDNNRITLEAWKESVFEKQGLKDVENTMPLSANYFDDNGLTAATFAIRYYPTLTIKKEDALSGGNEFIKEFDSGLRQTFEQGVNAGGGKLIEWKGTATHIINGDIYFVTENRQLSPRGEKFRSTLVRYLDAGDSFVVMIAYREDLEYFLKPICEKIIGSIQK